MSDQMVAYFTNIAAFLKSGFRPSHSTITALLNITDDLEFVEFYPNLSTVRGWRSGVGGKLGENSTNSKQKRLQPALQI
jgi:hypothetical protein